MENGHHSQQNTECVDTNDVSVTSQSGELQYEKKYIALLKRCTALQQNNEWLVNRLHHVKKLLRKIRHERRFLMRRLDSHQDRYADVPLILPADPDLELTYDLSGIPMDPAGTSGENRSSSKSSKGGQSGKMSTAANTSSVKASGKSSGKRKARSSKEKDRGSSKKSVSTKPIATSCSSSAITKTTKQCDAKGVDTYVRQIKVETLSSDVETNNWSSSAANSDSKKGFYDLYEHSYDLMQPTGLDLAMSSMHGNAETLS